MAANMRVLLTIGALAFVLCLLISSCSAKPAARSKRMMAFRNMLKASKTNSVSAKRSAPTKECQEIMGADDYKKFSDEVAYAYLNSGNINALDNLLAYMVDMKCLTIRETLSFRKELTTLYNLINKDDYEYDLSLRDVRATKRNAAVAVAAEEEDESEEYAEFENLLSQLAYINLEDEKANSLLHMMVEYVITMAENNQISVKDANKLLRKSYEAALIKMKQQNAAHSNPETSSDSREQAAEPIAQAKH